MLDRPVGPECRDARGEHQRRARRVVAPVDGDHVGVERPRVGECAAQREGRPQVDRKGARRQHESRGREIVHLDSRTAGAHSAVLVRDRHGDRIGRVVRQVVEILVRRRGDRRHPSAQGEDRVGRVVPPVHVHRVGVELPWVGEGSGQRDHAPLIDPGRGWSHDDVGRRAVEHADGGLGTRGPLVPLVGHDDRGDVVAGGRARRVVEVDVGQGRVRAEARDPGGECKLGRKGTVPPIDRDDVPSGPVGVAERPAQEEGAALDDRGVRGQDQARRACLVVGDRDHHVARCVVSPVLVRGRGGHAVAGRGGREGVRHRRRVAGDGLRRGAVAPLDRPRQDGVGADLHGRRRQGEYAVRDGRRWPADRHRRRDVPNHHGDGAGRRVNLRRRLDRRADGERVRSVGIDVRRRRR